MIERIKRFTMKPNAIVHKTIALVVNWGAYINCNKPSQKCGGFSYAFAII